MKQKIYCRIGAVLLALLMLLGCLAGCGNKGGNDVKTSSPGTSGTGEEPGEVKPVFSGNTYDYKEFTVLLRENGTGANRHYDELAIERLSVTSSEVNKAVYQRNNIIAEKLHISWVFLAEKNDAQVINDVRTGAVDADTYDLVVGHGRYIFQLATEGYFLDWNQLSYVNLEAPWWNRSAAKNWSTPGGKLFAMTGDISYLSVGVAGALFFNRDVFTNSGLTSPYDYVKSDAWTLENFMASAKEAGTAMTGGDGSGVLGKDTFGYVTSEYRGPIYVQFCAGDAPLAFNTESGQYEIGYSERSVTAVDTYIDFLKAGIGAYYHPGAIDTARKAFLNGQAAYYDDNIWSATELTADVNFGIVPWPKYEKEDSYIACGGSGSNTFAVMANTTASNRERISDVLEAMAYYGYKDVVPYYFNTVLSNQAVQDPDAYRMLQLIRENLMYGLSGYLNPGGEIGELGRTALRDNQSFSTKVQAVKDSVDLDLTLWYALDK